MILDVSPKANSYFARIGFNAARRVPVHENVPRDHPAHELLARCGGLHIGVGDDNTMLQEVRNDIVFEYTEPYGEIHKWEPLLRTRLVGIAETHHRHGLLFLSDDERFFNLSGMHDAMGFNGTGFRDAIDNLLFGQSKPMIRPDQNSVSWYGIEYSRDDPALYRYAQIDT